MDDPVFYRVNNDQTAPSGEQFYWVSESEKSVAEDATLSEAYMRPSPEQQAWNMQNTMPQPQSMPMNQEMMQQPCSQPMAMMPAFAEMKKVREETLQLDEVPCSTEAISLIMALTIDVLRTCGIVSKMGELEAKMSVSKAAPANVLSQQGKANTTDPSELPKLTSLTGDDDSDQSTSPEADAAANEEEREILATNLKSLVSQLENGLVVLYSKLPRAAVDALMTMPPAELPGLPAEMPGNGGLPFSFIPPRSRRYRPFPSSPYEMPQMMAARGPYFGQPMPFDPMGYDKGPRGDSYPASAMPPPRVPHPRRSNANLDRELTPPEHGWNAKYNSGVTGVVWDRVHQAWVVSWTLGGKRTFRHFTCKSYGGFDLARESAIEFRLARNKEIDAYNRRTRGR